MPPSFVKILPKASEFHKQDSSEKNPIHAFSLPPLDLSLLFERATSKSLSYSASIMSFSGKAFSFYNFKVPLNRLAAFKSLFLSLCLLEDFSWNFCFNYFFDDYLNKKIIKLTVLTFKILFSFSSYFSLLCLRLWMNGCLHQIFKQIVFIQKIKYQKKLFFV